MLWVSYGKLSQEGMKGMLTNPQNRETAVAKLVEGLGGKLVNYHLLLNGDIDFIKIAITSMNIYVFSHTSKITQTWR